MVRILEKEKSYVLRREGYSLGEISRLLKVSKSTASLWTKDIVINEAGLVRIQKSKELSRAKGHEILHSRRLARLKAAQDEADALLRRAKNDKNKELIALAIMYWCEGNKADNNIGFTNSDPSLVRAFIGMLKSTFQIDKKKIKICLHLHDYHDEAEMVEFWSSVTGIPLSQFAKTYHKMSFHKYSTKGYKGCARINYYDAHIARVLLSFAKSFIKLYI